MSPSPSFLYFKNELGAVFMDAVKLFFLENAFLWMLLNCSFSRIIVDMTLLQIVLSTLLQIVLSRHVFTNQKKKEQEKRQRDIEKLNLWL